MFPCGCLSAGQLAGRKGAIVANNNLVKIAVHNGLKHYMLAPLPRGKGAKKRAELGLTVRLPLLKPCLLCSAQLVHAHRLSNCQRVLYPPCIWTVAKVTAIWVMTIKMFHKNNVLQEKLVSILSCISTNEQIDLLGPHSAT